MKYGPLYVPTRRAGRLADTLYVIEQRGGWWTIIEEHATSPRRQRYGRQRRSSAERAIAHARENGQRLIVWGSLPIPAVPVEAAPLLELELS